MPRGRVKELAVGGLLLAVAVAASYFGAIPLSFAKLFPAQAAVNVLAAALLGPLAALEVAFGAAVLRMVLGTGTPLALPGGMVGAWLAGLLYRRTGRVVWAVAGEVVGTGLFGALLAYPVARWILAKPVLAWTYVVPFSLSSLAGALIGGALAPLVLRAVSARTRT